MSIVRPAPQEWVSCRFNDKDTVLTQWIALNNAVRGYDTSEESREFLKPKANMFRPGNTMTSIVPCRPAQCYVMHAVRMNAGSAPWSRIATAELSAA